MHLCILCTADEVNKKWKYLKAAFSDEMKKEKFQKSGMGCEDKYESKWRWKKPLEFLHDYVALSVATTTNLPLKVNTMCYIINYIGITTGLINDYYKTIVCDTAIVFINNVMWMHMLDFLRQLLLM